MYQIPLVINNEKVSARNDRQFDIKNPISGEVVTKASAANVNDAMDAINAAVAAGEGWANTAPTERRRLLLAAADQLQTKAEEASARALMEMGATKMWGGFNVHLACNMLREAASMTTQIIGEVIPSDVPGAVSMGVRQPVGVVLSIAPWNAPVILGVRSVAMAIACGNTVVFKASELCPATHALIVDAFLEAGFPPGVINLVTNSPENAPEIIEKMIAHPAVRRVNFTGSTRVGKIIAGLCAEHVKPPLLELGGKAPMIVLDDADVDEAVNAAAFGAYMNQGQICMSTERLIVTPGVAEEFIAKLAEKVRTITAGDPTEEGHILGAVVNTASRDRLNRLISDAVGKGAKLLAGDQSESVLFDAVLLDGITQAMQLYNEESFGPVLSIIHATGVDDAVRIANDTDYGLSAAVFSKDVNKAMAVARRIESGICHINSPTVQDEAQMPFGGVKASGYGRFGGRAGIDAFTELRWVTNQAGSRHYPF